jgi:hypothetical protein
LSIRAPASRLLSIAWSCPHNATEDAFAAEGIGTINGGRGRGRGQGCHADRPRRVEGSNRIEYDRDRTLIVQYVTLLTSRLLLLSVCYTCIMKAQTQTDFEFLPVVPIDEDTRAMLAYAASMDGRAHIEQARRELQEGKGIVVTPGYFDEMKLRLAKRRKGARSIDA